MVNGYSSPLVGKPLYTWNGSTMVGTDDRPDGVKGTAILIGKRLDVRGKRYHPLSIYFPGSRTEVICLKCVAYEC